MTLVQGSLGRFWLWAAIGALAMFGTFSFAGAIAWPFIAAGVGLLASRAVTPRRAVLALGVGIAALALMAALGTPWTLVVAILPALLDQPIEELLAELPLDEQVSAALIDSYNAILPELAKEVGALFVSLPAMPERHTLDGIHLNMAGYEVWDRAILRGIESAVCKSS